MDPELPEPTPLFGDQSLKHVPVDMVELVGAFDNASFEHTYFLDTETGDVIMISDYFDPEDREDLVGQIDGAPAGRYLPVEQADSREGYRDMESFIETVGNQHLQELLWVAIDGRGAFRRFKDVLLGYPEERERWFKFQTDQLQKHVRAWLREEGIVPVPRDAKST